MSYKFISGSMCASLTCSQVNLQSKKFVPKGMRKKIKGFSKDARRNLLWKLQSINYEELNAQLWHAYFITLTYQYSLDNEKEDFYFTWKGDLNLVKKDLKNFFDRLKYFFKKINVEWFAFWKMEFFSKALVPHFHLMLFVAPTDLINQRFLKEIISSMWVDTITNKTGVSSSLKERMYKASTNVRYTPMNRYKILQVYISKEIGKEYQINVDGYTGRFWGIENRKVYKRFHYEEVELISEEVFYKVRRIMKKYLRKKGYKSKIKSSNGMKLYYLDNVDDFKRLVGYFGEDYEKVNSG